MHANDFSFNDNATIKMTSENRKINKALILEGVDCLIVMGKKLAFPLWLKVLDWILTAAYLVSFTWLIVIVVRCLINLFV